MTRARLVVVLAVLLSTAGLLPRRAIAQSVRISGVTTVRYISVRPLAEDSIEAGDVVGDSILGETPSGFPVRCIPDAPYCHYLRPDSRTGTLPFLNDITVSAWGFGRGIQVRARMFVRTGLEGDPRIWPRADDPFDAVELYVDYSRPRWSARAGRQARTSGLGYYNYDGASVSLRPLRGLVVDGYAGWSLAQGLNEPRNSDHLAAIEPYAPDKRGLIFGAGVTYRPSPRGGASVLYQREIQDDRKALYSERMALAGNYRWNRFSLDATLNTDLALRQLNLARVQGTARIGRDWTADLFARRYRPFFELWTIWGAFSPVAFSEGGAGVSWRPRSATYQVRGHVAYRAYDDTNTSATFGEIRDTGWRVGANFDLSLGPDWQLQALYSADVNPGAARSEGGVQVQRTTWKNGFVGGGLQVSQLAYEYKIDEGVLLGLNVTAGMELSSRFSVSGGLQGYWHTGTGSAPEADWNQLRANLRLDWTLGTEPVASPGPPSRTLGTAEEGS